MTENPENTVDFEEFLEFYEEQFEYYDKKATKNKHRHRGMKGAQLVVAAILPVAATSYPLTGNAIWKWAIIGLSVALLLLEGFEMYLNYQKKWINYRITAEALRKEKQLFNMKMDAYDGANNPKKLFASRVMDFSDEENTTWETVTRKAQEA